jgi:hypothetical protein
MRTQARELQAEMRQERINARRGGKQVEQRKIIVTRNRIAQINGLLSTLDRNGSPKTVAMGVQEERRPRDANVLVRGEVEKPAQVVPRGFLQVMDGIESSPIPKDSSGRLQLAEWLTSYDNPQTARVFANRVWMHLFGEGLVRSPNNWGTTGESPTHPELLDHLAVRFMAHQWSIKSLIRDIVLTDAYQRSSDFDDANYEIDAENKLLWRASPRQLDAEALRDAMLAVSGKLNLKQPLASVVTTVGDKRVGRQLDQNVFDPEDPYRSIYLPVLRNLVPDSLAVFNFPDSQVTTAKREETNVPSQALYLMNSQFVTDRSRDMARRLAKENASTNDRIKAAFLEAYGRRPTSTELRVSTRFFARFDSFTDNEEEPQRENVRDLIRKRAASRRGGNRNGARSNQGANRNRQRGDSMQGDSMMDEGMAGGGGNYARFRFQRNAAPKLTGDELKLMLFCQSLLASAEFRILN